VIQPEVPRQPGFLTRAGSTAINVVPPALIILALFGAWELYVELSGIDRVTLPAPSRVLEVAWRNRDLLAEHSVITLQEAALGLAASISFGVSIALLIDALAPVRRGLYPLLVGSQTLPVVVIAPLFVLWFGFGIGPKILVVMLYTFFPITVAFASGLAVADDEARMLLRTLGASRWQTLRMLQIPQALPYLFTGLRIAVTYAMVGALFAEWAGSKGGLGNYVLLMRNSFRTDMVLAAIFLIAVLSLGMFVLVGLIEKAIVRWR
jgi:ABC-type nitrate/sulfonate/bicarbonate transport system permease component